MKAPDLCTLVEQILVMEIIALTEDSSKVVVYVKERGFRNNLGSHKLIQESCSNRGVFYPSRG